MVRGSATEADGVTAGVPAAVVPEALIGGPAPQLPENDREVFRRAGETAACSALAHRLKNDPTTWPYGRFAIYWKTSDGAPDATTLGYGEATDGCISEIAGQWHGNC